MCVMVWIDIDIYIYIHTRQQLVLIFNQNSKPPLPSKEVLENGIECEILRVAEDDSHFHYVMEKQIENSNEEHTYLFCFFA